MKGERYELLGWVASSGRWSGIAGGTETEMIERAREIRAEALRYGRDPEFATLVVSTDTHPWPTGTPQELGVRVEDFSPAGRLPLQVSSLKAVDEYLAHARENVRQAIQELEGLDHSPLLRSDEAFSAGTSLASVLTELERVIDAVRGGCQAGRTALRRLEGDR